MALKAILDSLDGLSEEIKKLYAQKDGKFHLDVEGVVPKDRLDEFRNNNIELKKQLDDVKKHYEGIDVEQVRELIKKEADLKEKKLIAAGDLDKVVNDRVAAMQVEHAKQIKERDDKLASSSKQLDGLLIDNAIRDAAVKAGVRDTAMEDVLLRGRTRYKVQDGKAVPMTADGKIVYGKDGSTPETMPEWLGGLSSTAPHLFASSTGSGANGSGHKTGAKSMTRTEFEKLSPNDRMTAAQAMQKQELVVTD